MTRRRVRMRRTTMAVRKTTGKKKNIKGAKALKRLMVSLVCSN
jgi:hypothetical protein